MKIDLTQEELKSILESIENGELSSIEGMNTILLFQSKTKRNKRWK